MESWPSVGDTVSTRSTSTSVGKAPRFRTRARDRASPSSKRAADRHVARELRLTDDRRGLDDVVEDDRQLPTRARLQPVEALRGKGVPLRLAGAAEAHADRPALLLGQLDVGAVAAEDVLGGAAGRTDEARAAVEHAQRGLIGLREWWWSRWATRQARSSTRLARSSAARTSCWRRRPAGTSAGHRRYERCRRVHRSRPAWRGSSRSERPTSRRRARRDRAGDAGAGHGRARVVGWCGAGEDRAQRDDAGDVDGIERARADPSRRAGRRRCSSPRPGRPVRRCRGSRARRGSGRGSRAGRRRWLLPSATGRRTRRPAGRGRGPGCC